MAVLFLAASWVHSSPCEDTAYVRIGKSYNQGLSEKDSAIYADKDDACSSYIDSMDNENAARNGHQIKRRKDPAIGYISAGIGIALIAGGVLIAHSGEKEAGQCEEKDSILKFCDGREILAKPIIGLGIVGLVLGVIGIADSYHQE